MQINIPHFKYSTSTGSGSPVLTIEADGKVVHEADSLDEFYKTFGYTQELKQAGVSPEDFLRDEYVKDNQLNYYFACMQMHIIDYLRNCSEQFRKAHGDQCNGWIAAYAEVVATRAEKCAPCRMNPFCTKLNPES